MFGKIAIAMAGINLFARVTTWFAASHADGKISDEEWAELGTAVADALVRVIGMDVDVTIRPKVGIGIGGK